MNKIFMKIKEYLPEKIFIIFHWSNQNKPRDSQLSVSWSDFHNLKNKKKLFRIEKAKFWAEFSSQKTFHNGPINRVG